MNSIYHIEGIKLTSFAKQIREEKIHFEIQNVHQDAKTPYSHFMNALDLAIKEEDWPIFFDLIERVKKENALKLYTLEKEGFVFYYRPFVLPNKQYPFLSTTFLYQKLCYPESFIEEGNTNFLEEFKVTAQENNQLSGYYQSFSYAVEKGELAVKDVGTFKMTCTLDNDIYVVTSELLNIRDRIRPNKTTYDYLFRFREENGISAYQMREYYLLFDEENVVHFTDEIDKIEVYSKENGIMSSIPYKVFSPMNIKKEQEQSILERIQTFFEQSEERNKTH